MGKIKEAVATVVKHATAIRAAHAAQVENLAAIRMALEARYEFARDAGALPESVLKAKEAEVSWLTKDLDKLQQ